MQKCGVLEVPCDEGEVEMGCVLSHDQIVTLSEHVTQEVLVTLTVAAMQAVAPAAVEAVQLDDAENLYCFTAHEFDILIPNECELNQHLVLNATNLVFQ